jgi:aryl carrier-like protein
VDDSLFSLGVDSLRAAEILARVRAICNVVLTTEDLYRDPTIRQLGRKIERLRNLQSIRGNGAGTDTSGERRSRVEI